MGNNTSQDSPDKPEINSQLKQQKPTKINTTFSNEDSAEEEDAVRDILRMLFIDSDVTQAIKALHEVDKHMSEEIWEKLINDIFPLPFSLELEQALISLFAVLRTYFPKKNSMHNFFAKSLPTSTSPNQDVPFYTTLLLFIGGNYALNEREEFQNLFSEVFTPKNAITLWYLTRATNNPEQQILALCSLYIYLEMSQSPIPISFVEEPLKPYLHNLCYSKNKEIEFLAKYMLSVLYNEKQPEENKTKVFLEFPSPGIDIDRKFGFSGVLMLPKELSVKNISLINRTVQVMNDLPLKNWYWEITVFSARKIKVGIAKNTTTLEEDVHGIELDIKNPPESFGVFFNAQAMVLKILNNNGEIIKSEQTVNVSVVRPCVLLGPLQMVKFDFGKKPSKNTDFTAQLVDDGTPMEPSKKPFPPQTFRQKYLIPLKGTLEQETFQQHLQLDTTITTKSTSS